MSGNEVGGVGSVGTHPTSGKKEVKLNFGGHCSICLQPKHGTLLEIFEKNPKQLNNFQPIIHYLTGTDPSHDKSDEEYEELGIPVMESLPPMCPSCYDILAELYWRHQQLLNIQILIQKQTELAREVINKAVLSTPSDKRSSSHREQFYSRIRCRSSGRSAVEIAALRKFLDNLHDKASAEGMKPVKFPSSVPLSFQPDSIPSTSAFTSTTSGSDFPPRDASASAEAGIMEGVEEVVISEIEDDTGMWVGADIVIESDNDAAPEDGPLPLSSPSQTESRPGPAPSQSEGQLIDDSILQAVLRPDRKRKKKQQTTTVDTSPKVELIRTPVVITICRLATPKKEELDQEAPVKAKSHFCDLCGQATREMVKHLEGHQVKDYITKCTFPNCDRFFSCFGKMESHLLLTHKRRKHKSPYPFQYPKTIKCDTCSMEVTRIQFRLHLQSHERQDPNKTLFCPISNCFEGYALKQSVEQHLMSHDLKPKTEQPCSICKELIKIEDIADHLKEAHNAEILIPCRRCPFTFPNWEHLLDHLYDHHKLSTSGLSCDLCDDDTGFKFYQYETLRQHYFNTHNLGTKYVCEHCNKDHFAQRTLSSHMNTVHLSGDGGDSAKPKDKKRKQRKHLKCELCPESSFYNNNSLLTHKIKVHGAPPVQCQFCTDVFKSVEKLKKHERSHFGIKRTYKCRVENCGREFKSMTIWREHEQGSHNIDESKLCICDTCGKGFTTSKRLSSHIKQVHLKKGLQPRVICDLCGEDFVSAEVLRRHNLIHTGERPHNCHICGQAFRHSSVLRTHVRAHEEKGDSFKPNGPMKSSRKRVSATRYT